MLIYIKQFVKTTMPFIRFDFNGLYHLSVFMTGLLRILNCQPALKPLEVLKLSYCCSPPAEGINDWQTNLIVTFAVVCTQQFLYYAGYYCTLLTQDVIMHVILDKEIFNKIAYIYIYIISIRSLAKTDEWTITITMQASYCIAHYIALNNCLQCIILFGQYTHLEIKLHVFKTIRNHYLSYKECIIYFMTFYPFVIGHTRLTWLAVTSVRKSN